MPIQERSSRFDMPRKVLLLCPEDVPEQRSPREEYLLTIFDGQCDVKEYLYRFIGRVIGKFVCARMRAPGRPSPSKQVSKLPVAAKYM